MKGTITPQLLIDLVDNFYGFKASLVDASAYCQAEKSVSPSAFVTWMGKRK